MFENSIFRENRMKKVVFIVAMALFVMAMSFMRMGIKAEATTTTPSANAALLETRDPDAIINNEDRQAAYIILVQHMNSIKALYDLSQSALDRMDAVFYQANVYIANTNMTVAQLRSYVSSVEADLTAAANNPNSPASTSDFLFLCNEVPVTSARYGQQTTLILSVVNLGKEGVTDLVITPNVSTKVSEWPFVIQTASDARIIESVSAASSVENAYALRQEVAWNFVVAENAMTGVYPLSFHVQYYRNGGIEETDLTTYINITGAPENGTLQNAAEDNDNSSTPRIIVTGFSTDPEMVYAGDTFNLTIEIKNTSSQTAVSNIQFDLEAAKVGNDTNNMYEAFLPTSGSATIYVDRIAPGETTQINIEMTARSDLAQKPYVIEVKANYEDEDFNAYQAATNVSIPVHQVARVDTGDAEILPDSIPVGGSTNVMFSIYNMGKTTLYNVQVAFEGDSVSGGNTFIGKIEPGATGNVDAMVNGIAPTMDEGYINAVISYEDEAGNVSTLTKEIYLYVYEEYYDDSMYMEDGWEEEYYDVEEGNGGSSLPLILGIVAAVMVVAVIVVIVIVKKKRKKNELLKDLEDIESLDDSSMNG